MIKAGIIGSTGYAGNEIVRLLLGHKEVKIVWYGSRSYIDKKYAEVYQNFFEIVDSVYLSNSSALKYKLSLGIYVIIFNKYTAPALSPNIPITVHTSCQPAINLNFLNFTITNARPTNPT